MRHLLLLFLLATLLVTSSSCILLFPSFPYKNATLKEAFDSNFCKLEIKEISCDNFFLLRMDNRISKRAGTIYHIIKETNDYVYLAKTLEKEDGQIFYSYISKCNKDLLKKEFPHYQTFDGIKANEFIWQNTSSFEPKFQGRLRNYIDLVPKLTQDHYVFFLKWDYSADGGPIIRRNFEIKISKKDINDIKVAQTFP